MTETLIPGYDIISVLGRGDTATVYHAVFSGQQPVALKILDARLSSDPHFIEHFRHDQKSAASLDHPNIGRVYACGSTGAEPYIAAELVEGESLRAVLRRRVPSVDEAAEVARSIGAALDHAHERGLLHRDVKPGNILFRDGGSAVLVDFGLARCTRLAALTSETLSLRRAPYVAPEVCEGREPDPRSDLYSLGIVLFEMLTGRPPFEGHEPMEIYAQHVRRTPPAITEIRPSLPRRLQRVIEKAMAKDPDRRYQTGSALAREFCEACAPRSGAARALPAVTTASNGRRITHRVSTARPRAAPVAAQAAGKAAGKVVVWVLSRPVIAANAAGAALRVRRERSREQAETRRAEREKLRREQEARAAEEARLRAEEAAKQALEQARVAEERRLAEEAQARAAEEARQAERQRREEERLLKERRRDEKRRREEERQAALRAESEARAAEERRREEERQAALRAESEARAAEERAAEVAAREAAHRAERERREAARQEEARLRTERHAEERARAEAQRRDREAQREHRKEQRRRPEERGRPPARRSPATLAIAAAGVAAFAAIVYLNRPGVSARAQSPPPSPPAVIAAPPQPAPPEIGRRLRAYLDRFERYHEARLELPRPERHARLEGFRAELTDMLTELRRGSSAEPELESDLYREMGTLDWYQSRAEAARGHWRRAVATNAKNSLAEAWLRETKGAVLNE